MKEKEIVICAAVKASDGTIYRGHRHGHCFQAIRDAKKECGSYGDSQGFMTSKNRFVTREEGRKLQDKAGIKSVAEKGYVAETLFSEDLY